jgi:hypothetical protein
MNCGHLSAAFPLIILSIFPYLLHFRRLSFTWNFSVINVIEIICICLLFVDACINVFCLSVLLGLYSSSRKLADNNYMLKMSTFVHDFYCNCFALGSFILFFSIKVDCSHLSFSS